MNLKEIKENFFITTQFLAFKSHIRCGGAGAAKRARLRQFIGIMRLKPNFGL